MKSEEKAFRLLYEKYYSSHRSMVNNMRWPGYGECDVLSVSDHGYVYEFEIKNTRADFLAELRNKADKHMRFYAGHGPNFMYFVAPPGIIQAHELPAGTGLIEMRGGLEVLVKAKRIHSEKAQTEIYELIANRLTRRAYGSLVPAYV